MADTIDVMKVPLPILYDDLADWWQVFSPTADYADEATFFYNIFKHAGTKTILELGAGGGNIASYLKKDFAMTLTDLAPKMLDMSKQQNPECEHIVGDMRTLRLNRQFDGVFIHDAIMYITSVDDLQATLETAYTHCSPGGLVIIAPDCTKESFKESTDYEGHDDGNRAVRYIQWVSDPNPKDTVFNYDFIVAMKENDSLKTVTDRQICGVFPRQTWLDLLSKAGFTAKAVPDTSTQDEVNERVEIFVATRG